LRARKWSEDETTTRAATRAALSAANRRKK
jgi:hypothetical protein